MPYRIHPAEMQRLKFKLAELLRNIPEEDQAELLASIDEVYTREEFGSPNLVRNCKPEQPYWYEQQLIESADQMLAAGKPLDAWSCCLREHNHGHSGFVDQSRRVYFRPRTEEERLISEELRLRIIKIAEALIASDPPKLEKGLLGDANVSMDALFNCLILLGADVPENLVLDLKLLVVEFIDADPENAGMHTMQSQIEHRFGS